MVGAPNEVVLKRSPPAQGGEMRNIRHVYGFYPGSAVRASTQGFTRRILFAFVVAHLAGAGAIFAVGEAHAHHPEISFISLR